jgi:hypothetical protein
MLITRACGRGLGINLTNTMPSARKSSAYLALPVTFATRSGVTELCPSSLNSSFLGGATGVAGATGFVCSAMDYAPLDLSAATIMTSRILL